MLKKTSSTGHLISLSSDSGQNREQYQKEELLTFSSSSAELHVKNIPEAPEILRTSLPIITSTPPGSRLSSPLYHHQIPPPPPPKHPFPAGTGNHHHHLNTSDFSKDRTRSSPATSSLTSEQQHHRSEEESLRRQRHLPPFLSFLRSGISPKSSNATSDTSEWTTAMGNGKIASQVDPTGFVCDSMVFGLSAPGSQIQRMKTGHSNLFSHQHHPSRKFSPPVQHNVLQENNNHLQSIMHLELLPSPPNSNSSPAEPYDAAQQQQAAIQAVNQFSSFCQDTSEKFCHNQGSVQGISSAEALPITLGVNPSVECAMLSGETTTVTCQNKPAMDNYFVGTSQQNLIGYHHQNTDHNTLTDKVTNLGNIINPTAPPSDSCAYNQSDAVAQVYNYGCLLQDQQPTTSFMTCKINPESHYRNDAAMHVVEAGGNNNNNGSGSIPPIPTSSKNGFQDVNKPTSSFGRYSVLPPVMTNNQIRTYEADSVSMMSYGSSSASSAQVLPSGAGNPFIPYTDIQSVLMGSSRNSGRSSFSGRGSRNKRAWSNSPLSAEGIDLNAIIRMSPTSLMTYLNGSRSSSSCISPGSTGEKGGCYGHLSARNSSSSPQSGSGSSGRERRSLSQTPRSTTMAMQSIPYHIRELQEPSNYSNVDNSYNNNKSDFSDIDSNLLVIQAMQELEASCAAPVGSHENFESTIPKDTGMFPAMVPECDNLRILPQDLAMFSLDDYIPFSPFAPATTGNVELPVLPPPPPASPKTLPPLPKKPPPSYDQHMASRKTSLLQVKGSSTESSSSSSHPSNSSSFESSEGDKTCSTTDSDPNRMYECRWSDCKSVFQDQEEFVNHIEKQHVEQKKTSEEFVCLWNSCSRKLQPFNARYKLLMHMRVHSGDKPNKCTYTGCKKAFSRLENLKIHMRSHTGERPYNCLYQGCPKTFSNSSDRAKHQKTHQDMRPYVCQVPGCGKRYTDPSSLRKHAKGSHGEKKEPGRKKIRGGIEELDPKDLSECLIIQSLKPISQQQQQQHYDVSPPEPTDSGLGRSPRVSNLSFIQDMSSSFGISGEASNSSRSHTGLGSSSQTSPSSHHSSPRAVLSEPNERNSSSAFTSLPPISNIQNHGLSLGKQQQPLISLANRGKQSTSLVTSRSGGSASSASSRGSISTKISVSSMAKTLTADQCPLVGTGYYGTTLRTCSANSRRNFAPDSSLNLSERYAGRVYK